jgi:hypothetical protein
VLEFKEDVKKKLFFWMQEPSDAKDEQFCIEVNKFINNPPQPGAQGNGAGGLDPSNMDQNQLLQFLASQVRSFIYCVHAIRSHMQGGGGGNLSGIRELLQRRMAQGGASGGGGGSGSQPRRNPASTASGSSGSSHSGATSVASTGGGGSSVQSNADALKKVIGNLSNLAKETPVCDRTDWFCFLWFAL